MKHLLCCEPLKTKLRLHLWVEFGTPYATYAK